LQHDKPPSLLCYQWPAQTELFKSLLALKSHHILMQSRKGDASNREDRCTWSASARYPAWLATVAGVTVIDLPKNLENN